MVLGTSSVLVHRPTPARTALLLIFGGVGSMHSIGTAAIAINRLRKPIYERISRVGREMNSAERHEP